jgi:putative membrane protein
MILTWYKIIIVLLVILSTSCSYIFNDEENLVVLNSQDRNFVINAGLFNRNQIEFGNLATSKSSNDIISDFASRMVENHTDFQNQLKRIAAIKNLTVPDSLEAFPSLHLNTLSAIEGVHFDSAYIHHHILFSNEYLKDYENQISRGGDQDLIDFATLKLPQLKQSLEEAITIQGALRNSR